MHIVQVVQGISFEHLETLEYYLHLILLLEVNHKTGIVVVSVMEFDPEALFISEFGHIEPIQADDSSGYFSRLEAVGDDENISHHHSVDVLNLVGVANFSSETGIYLTQKIRLSVVITPYTRMEVGVVALKQFGMCPDPRIKLLVGKSEIEQGYIPLLISML